jgi:hypothetical protein
MAKHTDSQGKARKRLFPNLCIENMFVDVDTDPMENAYIRSDMPLSKIMLHVKRYAEFRDKHRELIYLGSRKPLDL